MPDEERMRAYRDQQEELPAGDHGTTSGDSLSRTLTIALFVALGILVVLVFLLIR
jgi:hypothetical protein